MMLSTTNSILPTMMDNSLVYTDTYTISLLSTDDDGREYQCEVVINTSPSVMATGSVTLDVMGEWLFLLVCITCDVCIYVPFCVGISKTLQVAADQENSYTWHKVIFLQCRNNSYKFLQV